MHTAKTTHHGPIVPREQVYVEEHDTPRYGASIGAAAVATEAYIVQDELEAGSLITEADELRALEEQVQAMPPGTSMPADDFARVMNPSRRTEDLESGAKELNARARYYREEKTEELKKVRETLSVLDSEQRDLLNEYFNESAPAFLKAQQKKSNMADWATWLVHGAADGTLTNILQWHDDVVRKDRERLKPLGNQERSEAFRYATQQYESGRYATPPRSLDEAKYDIQDLFQTTLLGRDGFMEAPHYVAIRQGVTDKEEMKEHLSHESMHVMYPPSDKVALSWFMEAMTEDEALLRQHGTVNLDTLGTYLKERRLLHTVTKDDDGELARLALRAHTGTEEHWRTFKEAFDARHGTVNGFDKLLETIEFFEEQSQALHDDLRRGRSDTEKSNTVQTTVEHNVLDTVLGFMESKGISEGLQYAISFVSKPVE